MLTLRHINALRSADLIPAARYLNAAAAVRDTAFWTLWSRRALLAVGVGHLLAGIVFFFAYNWADMTAFAKFATVEAGLVVAFAGAWLAGIARPVGQVLLIAASISVGVLLAVIGQVYNTDADAYSLFAAWTVLILPWTLASRSAAHWAVWLVVLYLALSLYGEQALIPDGRLSESALEVGLGCFAAVFLALREMAARSGAERVTGQWTRIALLIAALVLLIWPAAGYVLDWQGEPYAPAVFVIALALAALTYRRWLPDFAATTTAVGFAALFAIMIGYRIIDEAVGFDGDEETLLVASVGLLVLWSVAAMGLAAKALQTLFRTEPQPS